MGGPGRVASVCPDVTIRVPGAHSSLGEGAGTG